MTGLSDRDKTHFVHPWEGMAALGPNQRSMVEGSKGICVTDAQHRRLIEGPAGMWCVQIGYGRDKMA